MCIRDRFKSAASACRHPGGITIAARGLLEGPRAPRNEVTWTIVKVKFPEDDQNSVQETATAARVASVTEPEEWSGPTWLPDREFNSKVAYAVINARNALSGTGSDGLRFSQLQSITRTQFGPKTLGAGIEAFWRRIVDERPTLSRRRFGSSFRSQTSRPMGKMPPGVYRNYVEAPSCGRDCERSETAYGGAQSRG